MLQPYYPIKNRWPFAGFPENTAGKTVLFSGGGLYKIYGAGGKYFEIVKDILDLYPNVVLLYAGTGDTAPFERFIKENNFCNRIFLLGFRKDITAIF